MNARRRLTCLFASCLLYACVATAQDSAAVLRDTLPNGLRVVVIRNPLAPVTTVEMNFRVGGDETPVGFPGMAHAQEQMAFRGCTGMTADQTAAIYAQLGGQNNADTQQTITQYFTTVPAADIDVALQAQAACLRGIDDSQQQWSEERGAIEQEVARDLSNPTYKFISRLNEDMFVGTPYAHDPLGTKSSFDATTGEMLKSFHDKWYSQLRDLQCTNSQTTNDTVSANKSGLQCASKY
jgi:zinc protease